MDFSGDVPRDVSSYTIVFCVVSQSKKELDLPFFAKVVLKAVCTRLKEFGYADVKIAKIACDEAYVMVQKVKAETVRKRRQIRHKRYQ